MGSIFWSITFRLATRSIHGLQTIHPTSFLIDKEITDVQGQLKEKAVWQDHTPQADYTFQGPTSSLGTFPASQSDSCMSGGDYEAETRNVVHSRGSVTKDCYRC